MREIDKDELELLRRKADINSDVDYSKRRNTIEDKKAKFNINIDNKKIKKEKAKKEKKVRNSKFDTKKVKLQSFTFDGAEGESGSIDLNITKKGKKEKKNKRPKEKQPFSPKKFFITLGIFVIISVFVSIVTFYIVDRVIYNLNNVDLLKEPINSLQKEKNVQKGIKIEDGMASVQYAYNNKYYTYLSDGKVYIKDAGDFSDVGVIESEYPICYYNLLYDKNRIFYITTRPATYSTYLQIWAYDIASGNTSEYNEFSVSGFNRVKDLEFSPVVNIIYLNVERTNNGYTDNVVYRIDLFNNLGRYASNMIVNKMVMLKHTDGLYFQDGDGINYFRGYVLRIFNETVDLIGVDLNDLVYFISSDRTKIYVVSERRVVNTFALEDTNMITWYSDNTNVYLIYPEYVCCISSDKPSRKIGKMSKYMTFQTIKRNKMYLLTNDKRVVTTTLDV